LGLIAFSLDKTISILFGIDPAHIGRDGWLFRDMLPPVGALLESDKRQGLEQDLRSDPPCHPRAVRLNPSPVIYDLQLAL